jgi:hypothetical protein
MPIICALQNRALSGKRSGDEAAWWEKARIDATAVTEWCPYLL